VRVPAGKLQTFAKAPAPLPPPVEPRLTLAEEMVLLSLDAPRSAVRTAVALLARVDPGLAGYRDAVSSLRDAGLLKRSTALGSLEATEEANVPERHKRVLAVIRRAGPPTGADAELLVLLAACKALPLGRDDHLHARMRIASIGEGGLVPPVVELLRMERNVDSMSALAEVLLSSQRDFENGTFDPGISRGVC
jgi:hypothetical protein